MAITATDSWSYSVQALVNVGRVKLADALGLQIPDSLEEERLMWGLVTRYFAFAQTADGLQLDRFRKKPAPPTPLSAAPNQPPSASEEEEAEGDQHDDEEAKAEPG